MKRRSFLKFFGLAPAAPIAGRLVASIPAAAPAVAAPVAATAAEVLGAGFVAHSMLTIMVSCSLGSGMESTWPTLGKD